MSTFRLTYSSVVGGGNNHNRIFQQLCDTTTTTTNNNNSNKISTTTKKHHHQFVGVHSSSSSHSSSHRNNHSIHHCRRGRAFELMSAAGSGGFDKTMGDMAALSSSSSTPRVSQQDDKSLPLSMVVKTFNNFVLDKDAPLPTKVEFGLSNFGIRKCKPFIVDKYQVGLISPKVLQVLKGYPKVFVISESEQTVRLSENLDSYESRSEALAGVLLDLKDRGGFVTLKGWRNECFEVRVDLEQPSLLRMERAATCLFGIRQFGVDITGYVKHPEKGLCIWLQKRSETKQRWPGMWDNMVGGGLSVGYSVLETAHKEAGEEASIPQNLLKNIQPAGNVSIFFESERGLSPNTEFVFDLELPLDFVPKNQDGEVSEFQLLTAKEAVKMVLSSSFKTTSCPVALDFLIRHGVLTNEIEPELDRIKQLLHIPLTDFYHKISDNN